MSDLTPEREVCEVCHGTRRVPAADTDESPNSFERVRFEACPFCEDQS